MASANAANIVPIEGRHIPYCLDGVPVIQNDSILVIDQLDNTICSCNSTSENLLLLGIMPASTSDCESQPKNNIKQNIQTSGRKWSTDATLFLIDQWQKNSSQFASTNIRNEEVWKIIVKKLEDAGFVGYTWKQAEDKWKNLRKGYMKVKDNQGDRSSGAAKTTCKFYDELDNIFRSSPSVQPISVASSLKQKSLPNSVITDDSDSDLENSQPMKKKSKVQNNTHAWLSLFKDHFNAKEEAYERRHEETLEILNKAITSYELQMEKLIEKL